MSELLSVGELVDKLIIENVKIFRLRDMLHNPTLDHKERVEADVNMNIVNQNRGVIQKALDDKLLAVRRGEPNRVLKDVKTYER